MKKLLISQSNYIPWKGFFDSIRAVDEYVIYDDVQYTRRDWRNRNRIKTPRGPQWLTIPVEVSGRYHQSIADVRVAERDWARSHWDAVRQSYREGPHFDRYREMLEGTYREAGALERLTEINELFLRRICDALEIGTPFLRSSNFELPSGKTERLVAICKARGATDYYTGPSARSYLDEALFSEHGIRVHYFNFGNYREYPQLYPPFEHAVSMLDLLLMEGPNALHFMKDLTLDSINADPTAHPESPRSNAR